MGGAIHAKVALIIDVLAMFSAIWLARHGRETGQANAPVLP